MKIAAMCLEAMFSLTAEEEAARIEGVEVFRYLGRLMDPSNNDWPEVLHNTRKARQVWGRIGKLLQREGTEPAVLEKFYCKLVQVILSFGAVTWVLTEPMMQRLEGAHMSFLQQVKHKKATHKRDGSWRMVTAEAVLKGAGTQLLRTYVDRRQVTVEEWVAIWTIFDGCAREMGYEEGGRLRVPWWRQEAAEKQRKFTVEAILEAATVRRQQESGRL